MSIAAAALLAALAGVITGGISARLHAGKWGGSSVAGPAVAGGFLALFAFGLFLALGFLVGLLMFSGPPDPTIALQCILLMALVWLALTAVQSFIRRRF